MSDIRSKDAVEEIRTNRLLTKETKEEDVTFYLNQQTARLAHMSGHDKVFEKKEKKRESFQEEREERLLLSVTAAAAKLEKISSL